MPPAPPPLLRLPRPAAPAGPGSASSACCRRGRCCGGGGGCVAISTSETCPRGAAALAAGGSRCRWTPPGPCPPPTSPGPSGPSRSSCSRRCPLNPLRPRPGGGAELSARLGLAGEESEDEGTGSGVTAIDNKIERAMVRFAPIPDEEEDDDEDEEDEAAGEPFLATPTPHSTRGGPGGIPPVPFDAPRAAAALLGSSWAARSALGGAAAAAMNVPPAQRLFRGLVSLAVPPPVPGPRRGVPPAPPPAGEAPPNPSPVPPRYRRDPTVSVPPPPVPAGPHRVLCPPRVPGRAWPCWQRGRRTPGGGRGCPLQRPPSPPGPTRAPPGAAFAMYRKRLQWGGANGRDPPQNPLL
uniref:basic proline-rich protein-like n=1 Tax=Agelaius phoeniceus TaxID=39638 RepID=UPI0023EB9314|nr:basic proline-rich protein-like [Agelaius phoeniceus]